ncbi:MAG: hypothetical protein BWY64_02451 [bacterium ADurb.Bin363]|nr:MAG: hypothetical protein BWY64_02451 [bacterium ADurb.Bin363]
MRISILSNINLDSLAVRVSRSYDVYRAEGYGRWVQEITNSDSGLYIFKPKVVFIILDGTELIKGHSEEEYNMEIEENIRYIEEAISDNPEINFFISNLDFWTKTIKCAKSVIKERRVEFLWEENLLKLGMKYRNAYLFDIKSIIESIGREQFYSRKLWYLAGMKYSTKGEKLLEFCVRRSVASIKGERKKCLVLDLDNTLWGGVVGEVGLNGIELSDFKEGSRYKDFQRKIKEIKDLGIILAVVSKNNYSDAIKVIREHKDMILKEEDFVSLKINWDIKSQNLKALAEELNIGLDSIVFVDDNPIEREGVKSELPMVIVPDFPEDTSLLADFAEQLYRDYFYALSITDEDTIKTGLYQQNIKRSEAIKSSNSYEDYLKSLDTEIEIRRMSIEDIQRASQLTQKTNQFNLTTKRYSEIELSKMLIDDCFDCFVASVKDRFGDNGMVCVAIAKQKSVCEVELDTFLLSCRVMGRFIEDQIINYIEGIYRDMGYERLITYYLQTAKNVPAKEFFERLGYNLVEMDKEGNKKYMLQLKEMAVDSRKRYGKLVIV